MNANGTGLRQLTAGPDWDWGPLVSPDGTRIAFSRMRADMPPGYEYVTFTYVMDSDGSNIRSVTSYGGAGAWSPDGATLAIDSYGLSSDVYLIGADGTNLRRLFRGDGFRQLVWSPDGSMFAFRRYIEPLVGGCDDTSGGWEIWIANSDGTGARSLRRLATCDGYLGHLSWTADGRILFEDRALEEPSPLWSMRADGSNVVQVLAPNHMSFGAWSPDGTLVTLLGRDIFLMRVADGAVWRVTANGMSSTAAFLP
jgi:Tol biopolymer transport system component